MPRPHPIPLSLSLRPPSLQASESGATGGGAGGAAAAAAAARRRLSQFLWAVARVRGRAAAARRRAEIDALPLRLQELSSSLRQLRDWLSLSSPGGGGGRGGGGAGGGTRKEEGGEGRASDVAGGEGGGGGVGVGERRRWRQDALREQGTLLMLSRLFEALGRCAYPVRSLKPSVASLTP